LERYCAGPAKAEKNNDEHGLARWATMPAPKGLMQSRRDRLEIVVFDPADRTRPAGFPAAVTHSGRNAWSTGQFYLIFLIRRPRMILSGTQGR
jgi:hypothetical protein